MKKMDTGKKALDGDSELIFALDIGTRSVIGIVGRPEGELLRVLATEVMEHTNRAVIDGQIEDIEQVAAITEKVKHRLEEKVGFALRDVCIAAAGRALKTQRARFELELEGELIREKQVAKLEAGAIQEAYRAMMEAENGGETQTFLCVGHSVVHYWLDDYELSNLQDHKGKRARVEVIATFLPSEVVDSLYRVMEKVGLTVASITLEPIAAMNAVIPRELRKLNLALADIGGGTSDIAVSNDGSVVAYTMATVAGDEITEAIMRECLVDFSMAERIKLSLGAETGKIRYQDVLGFQYTVEVTELMQKLRPTEELLAEEIANRIREANGKPPAAVFLVGGGSQIPLLCEMLAQKLSIAENKVAVGGSNYMKRMILSESDIASPEFATPMGIALTAMAGRSGKGLSVTLNDKKVALMKAGMTTVLEVLLLGGYQYSQIMGHSGANIIYECNGEKKIVRGEHPVPAEVTVNGESASVSTPVRPDDKICFSPAKSGGDAAPTVESETPDWREIGITLNGFEYVAGTQAAVNGQPAEKWRRIVNNDTMQTSEILTLNSLCRWLGMNPEKYRFRMNGKECGGGYELRPGDVIQADDLETPAFPRQPSGSAPEYSASGVSNPPRAEEPPPVARPVQRPNPATAKAPAAEKVIHVQMNGNTLELPLKEDKMPYQFSDMLNYADIDPTHPQGNIVLQLNGKNASYLAPVKDGDSVSIYWENEI